MLLANYVGCRAETVEDAHDWVVKNAIASELSRFEPGQSFNYRANVCRLTNVTFLWSSCDAPTRMVVPPGDFVQSLFRISGNGSVRPFAGTTVNDARSASIVVPPTSPLIYENGANNEQLVLSVRLSALKSKAAALIGDNVDCFELLSLSNAEAVPLRQTMFSLAHQLDYLGPRLSPVALSEIEQSIIVKFLLLHRNTYTHLLLQDSPDPGQRVIKIVDDYLNAHWDKDFKFEELSPLTGVSLRSLYRAFHKKLGITPSERLKQVRLNNARDMLLSGDPQRSVMQIGLKCGFQSLGHFSRDYRAAFGELPSETLRRSR